MKIWELLEPDNAVNEFAENHLKQLYGHKATGAEFEARLQTKGGGSLDVLVSTSRIFFSDKNGHVISFSEVSRTARYPQGLFRKPAHSGTSNGWNQRKDPEGTNLGAGDPDAQGAAGNPAGVSCLGR
ncbi:MAG: hypothetical protein V3V05_10865 [Pontiella sp.]